jgi:N-acyl-phosphatidylethanolamine-hydrolysing phospholipase D
VLRARGGGPRAAVYFAGDTGLHPEFAEVGRRCGPLALALLPVGAYAPRWFMRPVHCDPDDALAAYDALCAGAAAAHPGAAPPAFGAAHFGTFKLTDEPTDEPPRRTRAAWAARGGDARALWVPAHGETWRAGGG